MDNHILRQVDLTKELPAGILGLRLIGPRDMSKIRRPTDTLEQLLKYGIPLNCVLNIMDARDEQQLAAALLGYETLEAEDDLVDVIIYTNPTQPEILPIVRDISARHEGTGAIINTEWITLHIGFKLDQELRRLVNLDKLREPTPPYALVFSTYDDSSKFATSPMRLLAFPR